MVLSCIIAVFLKDGQQFAAVISNTSVVLQFCFLIVWAGSLVKLFKKIKSVQRLLPNKKIFVIHAAFIGTYLVCMLIETHLNVFLRFDSNCDLNCSYNINSIHDLLNVVAVTSDYLAYSLVLYMLLPCASRNNNKQGIAILMMNGFTNVQDLESAIIDANPGVSTNERSEISEQLGRLHSFLSETEEVSLLVSFVDPNCIAFQDLDFKLVRTQDFYHPERSSSFLASTVSSA